MRNAVAPARAIGAGTHVHNLYNDYVYFWRWALWKVFETTKESGVVSFITASSYVRGPGFVGMRQLMRQTFDELWIIDLEGDSLGPRRIQNVFAIRTPVAIAIGVRVSVQAGWPE
jgi:predicted helicase